MEMKRNGCLKYFFRFFFYVFLFPIDNLSAQVINVDIDVLPLNMGTSRKERMGKWYVNTKWIPTLMDKK